MESFDRRISVRLFESEIKKIDQIVKNDPEKFYNLSHFVRVAVIKLIRQEEESNK